MVCSFKPGVRSVNPFLQPTGSTGRRDGRFSRDPLPVFSARGHLEQFWNGQGRPLFDVVHTAFPLPATASPTPKRVLKDGVGDAVVTDMSDPIEFPSLDNCQKRFLWAHKEVHLAPHKTLWSCAASSLRKLGDKISKGRLTVLDSNSQEMHRK